MPIQTKHTNLLIHVFIWAVLLLLAFPFFFVRVQQVSNGIPRGFYIYSNLYHIALFYFNAAWLYPRLITKKTWWLYPPALVLLVVSSYYLKLFLLEWIWPGFRLTADNKAFIVYPPVPFLLASIFYRVIADRIRYEKTEKERKAERLGAELKFLRSQISPHFLFNTLTTMVSLARKKSDQLEPGLLKLSDLLRYMLYESNEEKFPIEKEIQYLKNYIELQQLRFADHTDIRLSISQEPSACTIEPMLLIPFVENAFKHGIGLVAQPFIHITIELRQQQLLFRVVNNYNKQNQAKDSSSGIGLKNVQDRLALLYPRKHRLTITEQDNLYSVQLNLTLLC